MNVLIPKIRFNLSLPAPSHCCAKYHCIHNASRCLYIITGEVSGQNDITHKFHHQWCKSSLDHMHIVGFDKIKRSVQISIVQSDFLFNSYHHFLKAFCLQPNHLQTAPHNLVTRRHYSQYCVSDNNRKSNALNMIKLREIIRRYSVNIAELPILSHKHGPHSFQQVCYAIDTFKR